MDSLLLVNSTFPLLRLLVFRGFCDAPNVLDTFTGLVAAAYFSRALQSFELAAGVQTWCCSMFQMSLNASVRPPNIVLHTLPCCPTQGASPGDVLQSAWVRTLAQQHLLKTARHRKDMEMMPSIGKMTTVIG